QQNRAALTLNRSVLSIGFGSYCDSDTYHGWVLRFNVATSPMTRLTHWVSTPATSRGAVWMGGAGFSADEADTSGAIYFATGNGPPTGTITNTTSLGNSIVKLAGSTTTAPSVADFFMPADVATQDMISVDTDVGSAGVLLIPGTSFLMGGGKNG